jgi:hypothetical protein
MKISQPKLWRGIITGSNVRLFNRNSMGRLNKQCKRGINNSCALLSVLKIFLGQRFFDVRSMGTLRVRKAAVEN